MIKHMDMAFEHILMVPNMRGNGKKINRREGEKKNGQMGQVMKENINRGKNQDMENLYGQMEIFTKDILRIIILMEREFILGMIKENMKESGKIIKWMGMVFLLG